MYTLEPNLQGSTLSIILSGTVHLDDVISLNDVLRKHSKTPGIKQLVLDLGSVSEMDISGLGVLVSLNTSMQRYGRRLVLQRTPPPIEKLLEQAEIEGFFPMCESEEELKGFLADANRR